MPPRRPALSKNEPLSLRREGSADAFTDDQLMITAILVASMLQAGHGVYLKLSADGSSLRLKVYTDDDTYQDNLSPRDNLEMVYADYARQLKATPFWEGLIVNLWERQRQGPAEAPAKSSPVPKGPKGG